MYILSIQILMSVVFKMVVALTHVQTLKEVSIVNVIVALHWMMMGLLVMVCIQTCVYMTGSMKTCQPFLTQARRRRVIVVIWCVFCGCVHC